VAIKLIESGKSFRSLSRRDHRPECNAVLRVVAAGNRCAIEGVNPNVTDVALIADVHVVTYAVREF
jgi:hypothetical protein